MSLPRELKIMLTKAESDPYCVLANRNCHNPEFCYAFIDQFNEITFDRPKESLERAFVVRRLAHLTRDPHLIAKSTSVLATAYRIEGLSSLRIDSLIADAEALAGGCICCLAEILRRKGVILLYRKDFQAGCSALSTSADYFRQLGNLDGVARSLISRGAGFSALGHFDAASEDERRALELLSVGSPSRYYISILINMTSIMVSSIEHELEEKEEVLKAALKLLARLAAILRGQKRRHERVRVIIRWIKGLICAVRGKRKDAFRLLYSARRGLDRLGLDSEVVAVSADLAKLYKIGSRDNDERVIQLAEECLARFPGWERSDVLRRLIRNPVIEVIEELRLATESRIPSVI